MFYFLLPFFPIRKDQLWQKSLGYLLVDLSTDFYWPFLDLEIGTQLTSEKTYRLKEDF